MQPLISVILPVYNAEKFITYTIESILQQTFKNFELIIINDGSKDKTLDIINGFNDERIILIDKENTGLTDSLNVGVQRASTNWIARIDGDDVAYINRFEEQIKYLAEDLAVLGTQCEFINETGKVTGRVNLPLNHCEIVKNGISLKTMFIHPSVIINKKLLIKSGLYDNYIYAAEDLDLWLKLSHYGRLMNLDLVLLKYRMHENKISVKKRKEQMLNAAIAIFKYKKKIYTKISEKDYLELKNKIENSFLFKLIVYFSQKSINKENLVLKFYNMSVLALFSLLKLFR